MRYKMADLNFFNSIENLEPRCPKCEVKLEYGLSTTFDDDKGCHVCNTCGHEFK